MIDYRRENIEVLAGKQYQDETQTFMNIIRSQRHDYNFHVQTLQGLMQGGNYDACRAYIDELLRDSIAMNALMPLADPAISALINSFRILAAQRGIGMEIAIEHDLSGIVTNAYETNKIVGNLLQNALDEVGQLPDKSYGIHLSILKRGEFCMIHVSNQIGDAGKMEQYQYGVSTKRGHEGIGLASIRTLAARYRGAVYSRMEGNIIHFVAKIPFRIQEV